MLSLVAPVPRLPNTKEFAVELLTSAELKTKAPANGTILLNLRKFSGRQFTRATHKFLNNLIATAALQHRTWEAQTNLIRETL